MVGGFGAAESGGGGHRGIERGGVEEGEVGEAVGRGDEEGGRGRIDES